MRVVPVRKQWMIKWGSDERDANRAINKKTNRAINKGMT